MAQDPLPFQDLTLFDNDTYEKAVEDDKKLDDEKAVLTSAKDRRREKRRELDRTEPYQAKEENPGWFLPGYDAAAIAEIAATKFGPVRIKAAAECLYAKKEFDNVLRILDAYLAATSGTASAKLLPEMHDLYIRAAVKVGRTSDAEKLFSRLNGNEPINIALAADLAFRLRRYRDAVNHWVRYLSVRRQDPLAWIKLAIIFSHIYHDTAESEQFRKTVATLTSMATFHALCILRASKSVEIDFARERYSKQIDDAVEILKRVNDNDGSWDDNDNDKLVNVPAIEAFINAFIEEEEHFEYLFHVFDVSSISWIVRKCATDCRPVSDNIPDDEKKEDAPRSVRAL